MIDKWNKSDLSEVAFVLGFREVYCEVIVQQSREYKAERQYS